MPGQWSRQWRRWRTMSTGWRATLRVLESGWRRRTKNLDAFRSQQRNIMLLIVIVLNFILFCVKKFENQTLSK